MNKEFILLLLSCVYLSVGVAASENPVYWRIDNEKAIVWDVHKETRLPHSDDVEMAGQRVACILRYDVARNRQLTVNRDLIFPQLRRFVRTSEPEWYNYRNYLRYTFSDEHLPVMIADQMILAPHLDSVRIDGKISFYHTPEHEIQISRTFFPSMTERLWVEKVTLTNTGNNSRTVQIGAKEYIHNEPPVAETLDALFEKLWADNGILVDPDQNVLWDRGTLYAFRGAFIAGAGSRALEKLIPFSRQDFLGRVFHLIKLTRSGEAYFLEIFNNNRQIKTIAVRNGERIAISLY